MMIPKRRNALTEHFLGYYRKEDGGIQRNSQDGGLSDGNQWGSCDGIEGHWPRGEPATSAD